MFFECTRWNNQISAKSCCDFPCSRRTESEDTVLSQHHNTSVEKHLYTARPLEAMNRDLIERERLLLSVQYQVSWHKDSLFITAIRREWKENGNSALRFITFYTKQYLCVFNSSIVFCLTYKGIIHNQRWKFIHNSPATT